ncbi:MAG TPA: flagellar biosynthesis anti-sigma factor FlgM [Verrucomicrobiae bacterium]|nr:flagellar biosynthesis anti-sigma factor FlgM [Verrucomicrobiae bacterium]
MRIEGQYGAQAAAEADRSSVSKVTARATSSNPNIGEDQTQLSEVHAQVAGLTAQALQTPELRQERVAALRLSVQSGQYRPSPEAVAGAIVAHMVGGAAA